MSVTGRLYCGRGKAGKYGINLDICLDDIPAEHITMSSKNRKRYVKLKVNASREPDDRGNTHYIEVDTWKPDPNYRSGGQAPARAPARSSAPLPEAGSAAPPPEDDLPFDRAD